jgi:hypothetical protein
MTYRRDLRIAIPAALSALLVLAIVAYQAPSTSALAPVVVNGVSINHSSAKIYYNPVPGAKDYRVYDIANPNNVKYAGWTHISPDPSVQALSASGTFSLRPTA